MLVLLGAVLFLVEAVAISGLGGPRIISEMYMPLITAPNSTLPSSLLSLAYTGYTSRYTDNGLD